MEEQKAQQDSRFLKGRHIAFMIWDNFKISGTGEDLLDFNELQNECNDVLLSMTTVPDEDTLENCFKNQLHFSGAMKLLMALQDTVPKGKERRPVLLDCNGPL